MAEITIRPAETADLAALVRALQALSRDLGDTHRAMPETLRAALAGPCPACHAVVAMDRAVPVGAALFSPVFSTTRGMAGLYVSDLWVAPGARGARLGRRLLAAAAARAAALWQAGYLRLDVYATAPQARGFYDALGFTPLDGQSTLALAGAAFEQLKGQS